MDTVYALIKKLSISNTEDEFYKYLTKIPIHMLSTESSSIFIDKLVSSIKPTLIPTLIKYITDKLYVEDNELDTIARLYIDPRISDTALKLIRDVYPTLTFMEIVETLIPMSIGNQVLIGLDRLYNVYMPTRDDILALIESANDYQNVYVSDYLKSKLPSELAPIPSWMITSSNIPDMKDIKIPKINIPNLDDIIDKVTTTMDKYGFKVENKDALRYLLSILPYDEKVAVLKPYTNDIIDDTELFKILGPANPFINPENSTRMFIFNDFDYDEDDNIVDWFKGICEECRKVIKYRFRAVRMPIPFGGWKGCYCSIECLELGLTRKEEEENKPDLITRIMIDKLSISLNKIGIIDRTGDFTEEQLRNI
jgi:hypothetical protein